MREHPVIRWAPDPAYPPVEWRDGAGQVRGLCPDYLALLGHKLGVQFQPVETADWTAALAAVRSGRADLLTNVTDTPERHSEFLFTQPYLDIPAVLLVRAGDATRTLAELGSRRLAIERGYQLTLDEVRKDHPRIRIVEVQDAEDGLKRLALGSVDGAVADLAQASWTIERLQLTGIRLAGPVPELEPALAMGVRPDLPLLRAVLDKALASVTNDERDDVRRHWIGLQVEGWRPTSVFWATLATAVAGAAALLILLWNRALRRQVAERTRDLAEATESLRLLSNTDALTGLKNRRYLENNLPAEVARVRRLHVDLRLRPERLHKNVDIAFALVDLDHFKSINDTHGHTIGDLVLRHVGEVLTGAVRETDTVVRWGGEEFLVIGRNTDRNEVSVFVDRLRDALARQPYDLGDGRRLPLTASIGFALLPMVCAEPEFLAWEDVVDLADRCLYTAKRNGRDLAVGMIPVDSATPQALRDLLPDLSRLARSPWIKVLVSRGDPSRLEWGE